MGSLHHTFNLTKPQENSEIMTGYARKMDVSRALSLLGMKSARSLETGHHESRRKQLDQALFNSMQYVQRGMESQQREEAMGGSSVSGVHRRKVPAGSQVSNVKRTRTQTTK